MDFKKLNEELKKYVMNEISDEQEEKRLIGKVGDTEIYCWETTLDGTSGKLGWVSNYVEGSYGLDGLKRTVYKKLAKELINNKQSVAIDPGLYNLNLEDFLYMTTEIYCGEKIGSDMADMFNSIFHATHCTIPEGFQRLEDITDPVMKSLVLLSSVYMNEGYAYTKYGDCGPALDDSHYAGRTSRIQKKNDKLILDIDCEFAIRDREKIKRNPDNQWYLIIAELPLDSINLPSVSLPPEDLIDCYKDIEVGDEELVEISPKYLQLLDYTKTIYEQRQRFLKPFQEKMRKLVDEWLKEHRER